MNRYVALGSSMAAGPGIRPGVAAAPRAARRSTRNYPHLVANALNFELVDVTFSGATTAHLLTERQHGATPQIEALDGSETLVTITIGGNDVGYVPLLMAATLPRVTRLLPTIGALLDRDKRQQALDEVQGALRAVGTAVRQRAPRARVIFVDYLTLLPPAGIRAGGLPEHVVELARHVADELERHTATAAAATGAEIVRAGQASREHHPWSAQPWTVGAGLPLPWRPWPFHPNAAGMAAVADMVTARLAGPGIPPAD
ncbi:SGNH/GDSL hydrolase family protein [Mycolicibacter kumamotonensis]|jgi:lysophospholipase L1-like esterase|uniref:Hydrolase n=1 Tax=Mycolicibacter kumamotonensis TaxID=354243 RepID=A0A1X0E6V6_9MYCO|nr:SGNH/GDSL hydrolase family protein [Mycolicibacter kumamotonensis]NDJ91701.1 SGNH/GDSL hydrolase family protein [Mycolicibacter kumamotonensis]ORA80309.1 hydrolase [Mycolicibacter kumamotonensis]